MNNRPVRNLILTGGINHDFEDTSAALREIFREARVESDVYTDMDAGLEALGAKDYDLVTVNALRWRMLDDDKYIPHRRAWGYEINARGKDSLKAHIAAGKGLLGLHTAAICFDTWDEWPLLLGAKWVWGQTFHPPPEAFEVVDINPNHPATKGLGSFTLVDEIYHNVRPAPGAEALFAARSGAGGAVQTLAWAQEVLGGRVIYNALGHDRGSVATSGHARFLRQAALWCSGAPA